MISHKNVLKRSFFFIYYTESQVLEIFCSVTANLYIVYSVDFENLFMISEDDNRF